MVAWHRGDSGLANLLKTHSRAASRRVVLRLHPCIAVAAQNPPALSSAVFQQTYWRQENGQA